MNPADVVPVPFEAVAGFLAESEAPRIDCTLGLVTAREVAAAPSQCFAVVVDGRAVGGYALRAVQHERGAVVWVQAAGGRLPHADLTASIMPAVEMQAASIGAVQVALQTGRRGLVAKLEKQGFEVTGYVLRKAVKHHEKH